MRMAVVSDIHGNLRALEAVIGARGNADELLRAGFGPVPPAERDHADNGRDRRRRGVGPSGGL
jgi:hypothetical protein